MATRDQTGDGLSFGPFNLLVNERLLTKEGAPVELGARALDLLIALTSTPNEIMSKKNLMSRVWPNVTVEEGNLRFHMAGIRKALGDGQNGNRYITTVPGRRTSDSDRAQPLFWEGHSDRRDGPSGWYRPLRPRP
jgi:DNA-binding winged helix-turn-helix (wHTH) protein